MPFSIQERSCWKQPLAIPKGLPGVLEPLAKAGFGGILGSDCMPILHQVLATLRMGALISLLTALSIFVHANRGRGSRAGEATFILARASASLHARVKQQRGSLTVFLKWGWLALGAL